MAFAASAASRDADLANAEEACSGYRYCYSASDTGGNRTVLER